MDFVRSVRKDRDENTVEEMPSMGDAWNTGKF